MEKIQNRKIATLIAITLLLTIAIPLIAIPDVSAQRINHKATYAYIGATPNPIGVGQETLLHVGITDELQLYWMGWEGLTVTVTKPDGTTETLGPFRTDSTGGTGTVYVPNTVGNYTFQTHFPAQWSNWTLYGGASIWYEASSSPKLTLVVTEEQRQFYQGFELPVEYWSRPIDAQIYEWNTIAGNWIATPDNFIAPYNQGPESSHILWAKPMQLGGLAGGIDFGPQAYECGDAYEGLFANSVIIAGVLYYNQFKADGGTRVEQNVVAIDLHTGIELWNKQLKGPDGVARRISHGQVFYWDSFNYHAVFSYLWTVDGSTWHAFDPFSARWVFSMSNVPTGTNMYGPKGEIYRYTVDTTNGWMTLWNSSRAVQPQATGGSGDGSWVRTQMGTTINAQRGIEWNKTIPKGLPIGADGIHRFYFEDMIFGTTADSRTARINVEGRSAVPIYMWGVSTKPGQEGQLLFNTSWTPPPGNLSISLGAASKQERVFTFWSKEVCQHWAFSLDTGKQIWGPTPSQHYLDMFAVGNFIAYGKLYSFGYGGMARAYDIKTGNQLWVYEAKDPLTEILWADNWRIRPLFVTDGKIYLGHSEHSPVDPKPRGAPFICLDAETGEEIWRADGLFRQNDWGGRAIIGDSIIATMDSYDERVYAIGKGPSAVTVTAPLTAVQVGQRFIITGTITDQSPGTKEPAITMRFPNGVPAVSDDNMGEWMLYVYKQFPRPTVVTGVPITIDVIDANGNYRNVGTAVSDASGMFSFTWQPDIEGTYTVIATFAGSKSYYPSFAQTPFVADIAPLAPQPTAQTTSLSDEYFVPAVAGIIVAIAIVGGILALLLLKKKP